MKQRLAQLAETFGLDDKDVDLLRAVLAPELEGGERATIGSTIERTRGKRDDAGLRARLWWGSTLVDGGLILVEQTKLPFLERTLRVPDRVVMHVLGHDAPDPALAPFLVAARPPRVGDPTALAAAIAAGAALCHLRDGTGSEGRALAAEAFRLAGIDALVIDLARVARDDDPGAIASLAAREARLRGAAIVAGPVDALAAEHVRRFARLARRTVLHGSTPWDSAWSDEPPYLLELPRPGVRARAALWQAEVGTADTDVAEAAAVFRLGPEQIARAGAAARLRATVEQRALDSDDLRSGARALNGAALERLARRIEPRAGWDDLVLPADPLGALVELVETVRQRERVLDEWGLRRTGSEGRGIKALFAGDSGTGKTLAAEVVAGALGLDLYAIDLATVVDKYIGETEKNLDRVFREAEAVNGVLFFDEADALFGKRSEISDARDRYANIEVAYLLQRMESFDGVAILASNLKANLDEAFARRLDAVIDFPLPDDESRLQLWDRCLGALAPRAGDLDLEFCAHAFELSGGNIRNCAILAASLASARDGAIEMADVIHAVRREYRKLGRICHQSEFGPYHDLVRT
ncbi:MAG: ATPase [Actinomycetia bacterium]|nr:ATPase [Actinomycetes bacterium]